MANMGHGQKECILSSDYSSTNAEYFKALATMQPGTTGNIDFEIEYSSDSFSQNEVLQSLNTMLDKVINTHEHYYEELSPYIDIESAMDYFILVALTGNTDALGRNYLLQTWDGIKWFFCPYDMDLTFGNANPMGYELGSPHTNQVTFHIISNYHRMFYIIYKYMTQELISRYRTLRNTVMSEADVSTLFGQFTILIPKSSFDYETLRWPETTGTSVKNYEQICNWYRLRVIKLDAEIDELEASLSNG
jgi:hypothetical protein